MHYTHLFTTQVCLTRLKITCHLKVNNQSDLYNPHSTQLYKHWISIPIHGLINKQNLNKVGHFLCSKTIKKIFDRSIVCTVYHDSV